ncbi:MAG: acyl-CoA dehydrogenase family protein [Acidimicrobiia bacterium]
MDELLPPAVAESRSTVNAFMAAEVNPRMAEIEASGVFPRELVRRAGALGLYGAVFPESVGGSNLGYAEHPGEIPVGIAAACTTTVEGGRDVLRLRR